MANILGSIYVELQANTGKFLDAMTTASSAARRTGRDIQDSFSRLGSVATAALAPFGEIGARIGSTLSNVGLFAGTAAQSLAKMGGGMSELAAFSGLAAGATTAVAAGAIGIAVHTAEAASKMYTLSQSTGVSVEALSAFSYVAKQNNVDQETMARSLERMSRSAFAAATAPEGTTNAYTRLGISVRDAAHNIRPAQELFEAIAAKFATMPDDWTKTALAIQLFGKNGADIIPVLNQGAEGIDRLIARAKALGIVLDQDSARAAHEFEMSLNDLSAAGEGLALRLMKQLLPALQATINELKSPGAGKTSAFEDAIDAVAKLTEGLLGVFDTLVTAGRQVGYFFILVLKELYEFETAAHNVIQRALTFDWSGTKAAAKQGTDNMLAVLEDYSTSSKKIWDDNAAYIRRSFGQQTLAPFGPDILHEIAGKFGTKPKGAGIDTEPEKADQNVASINRVIAALRAQTAAQLALAAVTASTVAAQHLQEAAGEADELISRMQAEADRTTGVEHAKLTSIIRSLTSEIHTLTAEKKVAKDAFTLNAELQKETTAFNVQIASVRQLAAAYAAGGSAIAAAGIDKQLEADREKISVLTEEFGHLSQMEGKSSTALRNIAIALAAANAQLETHRQLLIALRDANYDEEIEKQAKALRGVAPYLDALNAAFLENEAAVRKAQQKLALYQWELAHPGATEEQIRKITAALKEQSDTSHSAAIAQEAAQYEVDEAYAGTLTKLEEIRKKLISRDKSTFYIDIEINQTKVRQEMDVLRKTFESENAEMIRASQLYDLDRSMTAEWDRMAAKVGTFGEKVRAVFNEIQEQGKSAGEKLFGSFTKAIDDVSTQLAHLVVTGKADFKQLLQGLEEEIIKAGLQRAFAQLASVILGPAAPGGPGGAGAAGGPGGAGGTPPPWSERLPGGMPGWGALGGIFGGKGGEGVLGARGQTPATPLYVTMVAGMGSIFSPDVFGGKGAAGSGSTGGGVLTGEVSDGEAGGGITGGLKTFFDKIGSMFEKIFSSISNLLSKLIGSMGSIFGSIGKLFGGFLAGGGDVTPGKAYVVGEHHPEFFIPNQPGRISPAVELATHLQQNIVNVTAPPLAAPAMSESFTAIGKSVERFSSTLERSFGGFRAGGGDVMPGHAYIVGEQHPEFFVPKQAGQILPELNMAGHPQQTIVNFNVHGVVDADSFHKSRGQIMADLHHAMSMARSRNR